MTPGARGWSGPFRWTLWGPNSKCGSQRATAPTLNSNTGNADAMLRKTSKHRLSHSDDSVMYNLSMQRTHQTKYRQEYSYSNGTNTCGDQRHEYNQSVCICHHPIVAQQILPSLSGMENIIQILLYTKTETRIFQYTLITIQSRSCDILCYPG